MSSTSQPPAEPDLERDAAISQSRASFGRAALGIVREPGWWSAGSGWAVFLLACYIAFFSDFSDALEAHIRAENASLLQERTALRGDVGALRDEEARLVSETQRLSEQEQAARQELNEAVQDLSIAAAERAELAAENDILAQQREELQAGLEELEQEAIALRSDLNNETISNLRNRLLGREQMPPHTYLNLTNAWEGRVDYPQLAEEYYDTLYGTLLGDWGSNGTLYVEEARRELRRTFEERCGLRTEFVAQALTALQVEPQEVSAAREPVPPLGEPTGDRFADMERRNRHDGEELSRTLTIMEFERSQRRALFGALREMTEGCLAPQAER